MELLTSRVILIWRDKYIFVSVYTNLIAIVDKEGDILQVLEIENEKCISGLFVSATIIEDKLILAPYRAKKFHVVDLSSKKQNEFFYSLNYNNGAFLHTVNFDNKIWFIGENCNKIVCSKFEDDKLIFESEYEYENEIRWAYSYSSSGNRIIVPSRNTNHIMIIEEEKKHASIVKTQDFGIGNNKCYKGFTDLSELEDEIYIWDSCGEPHNMTIIDGKAGIKDAVIKTGGKGWRSVSAGDKIYRFSNLGNQIDIISKNEVEVLSVKGIKDLNTNMNYFQGVCPNGELIIFQNIYGEVFKLNISSNSIETVPIRSKVEWTKFLSKNLNDEVKRVGIIQEKYDNSLTAYLNMLEDIEV